MKKLSTYLFEVIAIFIGITSSFLVDEWRETNEQEVRLSENLKAIKTDLIQDTLNLSLNIDFIDSTAAIMYPILKAERFEFKRVNDVSLLNSITAWLVPLEANNASYRSLLTSTHIHYLKNSKLKSLLHNYYENLTPSLQEFKQDIGHLQEQCSQLIIDNTSQHDFGIQFYFRVSGDPSFSEEELFLALEKLTVDFNRLMKNSRFKNLIEVRLQTMLSIRTRFVTGDSSIPAIQERAAELIELIDQELR